MLDMRRRDEAEGESRIMGSDRFEETAEESGLDVLAAGRAASEADFDGRPPGRDDEGGTPLRRPRKVSACLRTCEKSCLMLADYSWHDCAGAPHCRLDASQDSIVVSHSPFPTI